MSFFADARDTVDRYGKYMTEYQELFGKHDVSFGSPQDFFRLAPRLTYDDSFRTDFATLTKSVRQREESRLSLTQMLTIIAIAMGGTEIERVGSEAALPISLTVVFLAGIGGWNETDTVLAGAPAGEGGTAAGEVSEARPSDGAAGAGGGEPKDEQEGMDLQHRLSGTGEELENVAAALFSGPAMLKEALSRLELNTLQLKLHLDSIDSRMERIEPHLDDLAWRFAAQTEAPQSTEEKTGPADLPEERMRFSAAMKAAQIEQEELTRPREMDAPPMMPGPAEREKEPVSEVEVKGEPRFESRFEQPRYEQPRYEPTPVAQEVVPGKAAAPGSEWAKETAKGTTSDWEHERAKERAKEITRDVLAGRETARWRDTAAPVILREPEPVPEPVLRREPEPVLRRETEPVLRREPEPLLRSVMPESAIRVPFGEYLRSEDEEEEEVSERRWGRWAMAALLVVAVAGGALVYNGSGWQGFRNGWQHGKTLSGAAFAKGHEAMVEFKGLWAKPAATTSQTQGAAPAAASGGGMTAAPASSAPGASGLASPGGAVPASVPGGSGPVAPAATTAGPSASATQSGAAAPSGDASRAGTLASRADTLAQRPVAPAKRRSPVVVEEVGPGEGGASYGSGTSSAVAPGAARAFGGGAMPRFVEASRLTVLSRTQPEYPKDALAQGITGEVVVQAMISRTGMVESAQIVSGPAGLLKASLDAIKSWRYRPYLVNGEPVEIRTYVKFRFGGEE